MTGRKTAKMSDMIKRHKASSNDTTDVASGTSADSGFTAGADENLKLRPGFNLTDHFLIAMPSMLDPIFVGTVVYLCEHNQNGALGVVINKPVGMTMDVLFDRIDLKLNIVHDSSDARPDLSRTPVMFGG